MKRWILVLVPLLLLGVLITWRLHEKTVEAAAQTQMRTARMKAPPVVAVAAARVRDIVPTFESVGGIDSPFNVKIAAKATGRIDYMQAREGDRVTQGQVLVRIDPSEIEAQVRQQQAAVAEAESRLAQAQLTENPTSVNVSTQISQQQAGLDSAVADYNQVKQNYRAQVAAAQAAVTDTQGRVSNARAAMDNARAAIRSAQANLDNSNSKYKRVSDLYQQGFIAAQDVDDARTAADVQKAALDVANGQLNAATAQWDSAKAQQDAAQQQAAIVKTKGKADIDAAYAKVVQAKAALRYAKSNRAQMPAYKQSLKALADAVAAAQAGVRNAQAQLANTVLTSPINGFVTARYMDPGAMATPGQPILAVQSVKQVWVTVPVPEEVSRSIYLGLPATARLDALPGRTFTGKVTQVNAAADPMSRQFQVRVTLDNAQNLLKPGMFARMIMVTHRTRGATVVPREAIQQGPSGATVIVVNDANQVEHRAVTLGASDANGIAVSQGLRPGEHVVIMSAMPLKDGQVVRIGGRPGGKGRSGPDGSRSGAQPASPRA